MGLTLIAILTAALLLPGIVATRFFYRAGQTREVDAVMPSLSSADGIARIGTFSLAVHLVYAAVLAGIARLPPLIPLPLADPYRPFLGTTAVVPVLPLLSGLVLLCLLAVPIGQVAGRLTMRWGDPAIFYGALAEVIAQGQGDDRVIIAYVLAKIEDERDGVRRILGYEGAVAALIRDEDRFPAKLVLKDAAIFHLELGPGGPVRRSAGQVIDWIALTAPEWHNVAFKVFQVVEDPDPVVVDALPSS